MVSGIYCIVNLETHEFYIGSSRNLNVRKNAHLRLLVKGDHGNIHLQRAWNKYGIQCFDFRIIQFVAEENLLQHEQFWLDALSPTYNMAKIAGRPYGFKHNDDFKQTLSERNKGNSYATGLKRTDEHKQKLREIKTGVKRDISVVKKMLVARAKTQIETSAKISITLKNKPFKIHTCIICKVEFTSRSCWQVVKYCSQACRNKGT